MNRMPRSACTRHPKNELIDIPTGYRYCRRCHHLVPPEIPIEPELTERDEAAEEALVESVEVVMNEVAEPDIARDKTELEAVAEHLEKTATAIMETVTKETVEALEAKPEPIYTVESSTLTIGDRVIENPTEEQIAEEMAALSPEPEVEAEIDTIHADNRGPDKVELEAEPEGITASIEIGGEEIPIMPPEAKPEVIVREEESQEETAPAEAVEPIAEETDAVPPEEEEGVEFDPKLVVEAIENRDTEIAILRAKLAELTK